MTTNTAAHRHGRRGDLAGSGAPRRAQKLGDHKLGTVAQRDERFVGELVETRGRAPVGLLREIVLTDNGR